MSGLLCDCCRLPVVPLGGEALCECPCEACRDLEPCRHGNTGECQACEDEAFDEDEDEPMDWAEEHALLGRC